MSASVSLHRIKSVSAERHFRMTPEFVHDWLNIDFVDDKGQTFRFSVFCDGEVDTRRLAEAINGASLPPPPTPLPEAEVQAHLDRVTVEALKPTPRDVWDRVRTLNAGAL